MLDSVSWWRYHAILTESKSVFQIEKNDVHKIFSISVICLTMRSLVL